MKGLCLIFVLLIITPVVNAQDSKSFKIHPFNQEEFQERLSIPFQLDTMNLNLDTLTFHSDMRYPMRIINPPIKEIAPLPNMPIRDDIHYHMKIKDYLNSRAPAEQKYDYKK